MTKHSEPILIVGDYEEEIGEIKYHLDQVYKRVYVTKDEKNAKTWFETEEAAVLLLAFRSLRRAEAFYLKLFHSCERIYEIPHQVIVFIARSEMERAYELCRREIFHSFVIVRPLLSEQFLLLSVIQALEKRESHLCIQRGRRLLKRLGKQVERLHGEFDMLMEDNQLLQERNRSAQRGLADSINYRLGMFRDSLQGPSMRSVVSVHDTDALNREFEQLQEGEIASQLEYYHGKMNEALNSWIGDMEKHLKLLEQVSTDMSSSHQLASPQILIIDDDDIQRHMLTSLLEEKGYTTRQASNGNEGMSMLQGFTPDLVLLDYEMPDLDGAALLRKARQSQYLKDLPFIMLTGHHEKEVVQLCMRYGANEYLVKPVDVQLLYERLNSYFPNHALPS